MGILKKKPVKKTTKEKLVESEYYLIESEQVPAKHDISEQTRGLLAELADVLSNYLPESDKQILTKFREIPCPGKGVITLQVERTLEEDILVGCGESH